MSQYVFPLLMAASLVSAEAAAAENVNFTVNATADVKPISRFIYGINAPLDTAFPNLTLRRMGGNRWTAYNWVNNASNAGSDYIYQNDDYLGGGNAPGGALISAINNAASKNAALLVTIPIGAYVAADKKGDGDVRNSPNYLETRFRQNAAAKASAFDLTPDPNAPQVYQDEFVNWVKVRYPQSQAPGTTRPIWFSLDNEPDLWSDTHAEVHPNPVTYAELTNRTRTFAAAAKAVAPRALVFGPVSYGFNGYVNLQNAPDANGRDFLAFYLRAMKQAGASHGKRLLDVLDLHWYPEAQGGGVRITAQDSSPAVVAARVQAPRSLWDKSYRETSWIADDYYNGPIYLLPRLFAKIAANYPGTRLGFTEYNYGGGQHISGGIAQADVLGIFGRYGVFAATQWPLYNNEDFVAGAFKMYRDYDGNNGSFGDRSVSAQTNNVNHTSIYASRDSTNPNRMVLVLINKSAQAVNGTVTLKNAPAFKTARLYRLTAASSNPVSIGKVTLGNPARVTLLLPSYSVTTVNLTTN